MNKQPTWTCDLCGEHTHLVLPVREVRDRPALLGSVCTACLVEWLDRAFGAVSREARRAAWSALKKSKSRCESS